MFFHALRLAARRLRQAASTCAEHTCSSRKKTWPISLKYIEIHINKKIAKCLRRGSCLKNRHLPMATPLTNTTKLTPFPGNRYRTSDVEVRLIVQDDVGNLGNVHFEFLEGDQ